MITINGIPFYHIAGDLESPELASEDITKPGHDLQTFRAVGLRSGKVTIRVTRDYDSYALAKTDYRLLKAIVGSHATVSISKGNTFYTEPYVFIHSIKAVEFKYTGAIAGYMRYSTTSYGATVATYEITMQVNSI